MSQFLTRILGFPVLLAVVMIAMVLLTALLLRTKERRTRAKAITADTLYFGTERVHGAHFRLVHDGEGVTLHAIFPLPREGSWEHVLLDADTMDLGNEARGPLSKVTVILGKRTYALRSRAKSCEVITHPGGARFAVVSWDHGTLAPAAT